MALTKAPKTTSAFASKPTPPSSTDTGQRHAADNKRRQARTLAKQQQAAERISSFSGQLAAGVTQAATAADQLSAAINQIASGAEQASGTAQESLTAVNQISKNIKRQSEYAVSSESKTEVLQTLLDKVGSEIGTLVDNISVASDRQNASVEMMNELEKLAANINEAVQQVMRIADQTNLLALNAAIEAGRAGKHGKGFAVVADTVRALAETAESNAGDIAKQIGVIQEKSRGVGESIKESVETALEEVAKGKGVNSQLALIKADMNTIYEGAQELNKSADELGIAAVQSQKASEDIASAAEEQSAVAEEVVSTLEQQAQALRGAEQASQGLEELADELKNSTDIAKSSEELAASAEELSSSIEEIDRSATEISTAIDQVSKGAEGAAAASEEALAGMNSIEEGIALSEERATMALELGEKITTMLNTNKDSVDEMITGITAALETGRTNIQDIDEVVRLVRVIDKVTDAIATVAIKTSMLAVNGAVEAAGAGEFGKGFAVVSGDIQNLADDAAQNVDTIKDLVRKIQEQALKVQVDLNEVTDSSLIEVNNAKASTDDLVTIETDMIEVLDGNLAIKKAAAEIAAAVTQVKKGMEEISAVAEQASSSAQQAGTASEQQSKGAESLSKSVEEIASIADELQSA